MKRLITLILLTAATAGSVLAADSAALAVGFWKSVSDVKGEEGKVTALWKLTLDAQGQLQGAIVWSPTSDDSSKYASKKAEFNGKPVRGTFWMKGLKKAGSDGWAGGTIVDVGNEKGDVYGCEVKVIDGGKKLAMRGYIGIALLGRTQTWVAADDEEVKKLTGH